MSRSAIRSRAAIAGIGRSPFGRSLGRSRGVQEGVHFVSQVLDCPPEAIRAGMDVEAVFVPASDEITLVEFRRARGD